MQARHKQGITIYTDNAKVYSMTLKKNCEVSQSLQVQVLQHNFLLKTAARKTSIVNGRAHQCTLDTGRENLRTRSEWLKTSHLNLYI
jgi:hypothetical protein